MARPRISSGAMRCKSVVEMISSNNDEPAASAIATKAKPNAWTWPSGDQADRHQHRAHDQRRTQPSSEDKRAGDECADHAAYADRRVQYPCAGIADLKYVDGQHDGQHAQPTKYEPSRDVEQREAGQRPQYRSEAGPGDCFVAIAG